jgi:putative ABC transport system permease protein
MRDGKCGFRISLLLSRVLGASERAEWFEPSYEDALAVHVSKRSHLLPAWKRLASDVVFEAVALGLVVECLRLKWVRWYRLRAEHWSESWRSVRTTGKGVLNVNSWLADVRYAWRGLWRRPGFTAVAVLTLALGIGANTAIFSVVNAVLLRSLPYADADRLVVLWGDNTASGSPRDPHSPHTYDDYVRDWRSVDRAEGITPRWNFTITGDGEPERVNGYYASAGFLGMLGVKPVLGRGFEASDDRPEAQKVVLISHGLWQRRYGGSRDVIAREIHLGDATGTIIGVLPAEFRWRDDVADIWLPLQQNNFYVTGERRVRLFEIVAHLRPESTLQQAQAEAQELAARMGRAYRAEMDGIGARVLSLREDVVGPVKPALMILLGAVVLVLLIACANVANLLLLRSDGRRRDVAVRAALGASRARLAREMLAESGVLALLGGGAGFLLAFWGVRTLLVFVPASLPRRDEITLDLTVLAFTLGLSLLTGLLFGLAPLFETFRANSGSTLKGGTRTTGGRRGLKQVLVAGEVALAVVVATSAALLVRSFSNLNAVNPGFRVENVLSLDLSGLPADPATRLALTARLHETLQSTPGIVASGEVSRLPLGGANNMTTKLDFERRPRPENEQPEVDMRRASASYFEVMNIPVLAGRVFAATGGLDGQPVAVINKVLADRYFAGEDPVGHRVSLGGGSFSTIVGIVGSTRFSSMSESPRPEIYLSTGLAPLTAPQLVVRTQNSPETSVAAVRAAIRSVDPNIVIGRVAAMEQLKQGVLSGPRFNTLLFTVFAILALVLSTLGAWGVMAYSVAQRTREIGVRMSVGARPRDVARMVLGDGMKLAAAGVAAGIVIALLVTRVMAGLLFEISPTNPGTLVAGAFIMSAAVLAAALASARRATRVDLVRALRADN